MAVFVKRREGLVGCITAASSRLRERIIEETGEYTIKYEVLSMMCHSLFGEIDKYPLGVVQLTVTRAGLKLRVFSDGSNTVSTDQGRPPG